MTLKLDTDRQLAWTALLLTVAIAVGLAILTWPGFTTSLGDTDDAMRLVIVRRLLHGGGWFDQKVMRLQPPEGVYLHWSRLLDGAIAALNGLLGVGLPSAQAEAATRFLWPLLLIFPAVFAVLALSRSLHPAAPLAATLLLALDLVLFRQFMPGRIDHHNVQIVLCLLTLMFTARGGVRDACAAGAFTALGLSIGLEALPFLAIAGAAFAVRFLGRPDQAGCCRAYGLALAASSAAFFLVQTPPWRWATPACDALGTNLVAGLVVAGLGLAGASMVAGRGGWRLRLAAVAATGLCAGAAYIALHPACLRGPMADIDRRLFPLWLNHVAEIHPLTSLFRQTPRTGVIYAAPLVMGVLAAAWLLSRREHRRNPVVLLLSACLVPAAVLGVIALRGIDYPSWFAMPLLAAAVADIAGRLRARAIVTVVLACVLSPFILAQAAIAALAPVLPPPSEAAAAMGGPKDPRTACWRTSAYDRFENLPPGLVLAEVDLGPFILAKSRLSVLGAPYHRMTFGILATYAALGAPADQAERQIEALHVDYVASCRGLKDLADHAAYPPGSLQGLLDRDRPPGWLQRLSAPGDEIAVYRVMPRRPG